MMPYYEDEWVALYHGDAREWDQRADVLITDPPYGVGLVAKKNLNEKRLGPGLNPPKAARPYTDDPSVIRDLVRREIPRLLGLVDRALIFPGQAMVFDYPEPAAIGAVYLPAGAGRCAWGFQLTQPILYYGKDPYLADGKGGRPNGFRTEQMNRERVEHPCPKPLAWMRWAVARASREGETVLDPFAGSGTTLRAAKALGRKAIGIEIEERYCEEAAKWLSQEVLGLTA